MEDLSPEVLSAIEGGTETSFNLLSVPQDGSVTPEKTTFVQPESENMFNKSTAKKGLYYNLQTGELVASPNTIASELIAIKPGHTYHFSNVTSLAIFDKDTGIISSISGNALNLAAETKARFIGLNIASSNLAKAIIVERPLGAPYVAPEYSKFSDRLESKFTLDSLEGLKSIDGSNLFDHRTTVFNSHYNLVTGKITSGPNYNRSIPIEVEPGYGYHKSEGIAHVLMFDENMLLIRASTTDKLDIGGVSNVKYLGLNITPREEEKAWLVKKEFGLPYENILYEPYVGNTIEFDKRWSNALKEVSWKNYMDIAANDLVDNKAREIYLPDFSGYNEPYHPSIIYVETGFAGYKYWMVQSPYPDNSTVYRRDRWEVPVVYKSNDGLSWIVVADPLDDLTPSEIANNSYMSDPHILYREDIKQIEVWYRLTHVISGELPTTIYRKTTSDGVNWTEREEMITAKLNTADDFSRSPSFIWDSNLNNYRQS